MQPFFVPDRTSSWNRPGYETFTPGKRLKIIVFRRILSISLALMVLLSSLSVSIGEHLCGGRIVSKALFAKAARCAMEKTDSHGTSCPIFPDGIAKSKCCDDRQTVIPGVQHLTDFGTAKSVQNIPPVFTAPVAPTIFIFKDGLFATSVKPPLTDYHPPQHIRDLPVLLQVFRI